MSYFIGIIDWHDCTSFLLLDLRKPRLPEEPRDLIHVLCEMLLYDRERPSVFVNEEARYVWLRKNASLRSLCAYAGTATEHNQTNSKKWLFSHMVSLN